MRRVSNRLIGRHIVPSCLPLTEEYCDIEAIVVTRRHDTLVAGHVVGPKVVPKGLFIRLR
eukprot:4884819-Amphidinium_carterae.1